MSDHSIEELFNQALDRVPEERGAFVERVCADDLEKKVQLYSLLANYDQVGSFMAQPLPVIEPATQKLGPDDFGTGHLLGDRYRIESLLGQGGMGEVWRAWDLKLHVDVALKRLYRDLFSNERRMEMLRHEVRTARRVMSPHVCRIFDLVDEDGQELVSMELVDGQTLQDLLKEKAPMELREVSEIAAQLLAGLESIHAAGLIHRDVKPANIMITRAGRVVLMDFGLAKGLADAKEGSIAGTPAYMAPEQARGAAPDGRVDIFAAGVILAEMISGKDRPTREALWEGLREDPPNVPSGPWEDVLRKSVAWSPEDRYASAREMARALEDVILRADSSEESCPYPGLNPFSANEAQYFFGREGEVEAVWKKLQRSQMSALVGLSGIGKSSFIRAGLIPSAPDGWRSVVCIPGASPFKALAQAMVSEMAGDSEAMEQLLEMENPAAAISVFSRWRRRHGQALLVLDQFEELFTLNRPKVQARFADLLSRIALEADVRILISLRDDFLFECHEHEALRPVFADLTLLGSLSGSALRRALVQPALACGYRYEDDALVDEMIASIHGERGALPLLAFAAASMWEHRSRTDGLLTRETYERIGGVGGALARYAEATMEKIGVVRHPMVREIFRNLTTAQGTRATRSTSELLTLFEDQEQAGQVIRELVEARLLTSFEALDENQKGDNDGQRVEIIHESLLSAWPRLVRWRTQDQEGAQLHDQLRQAAQLWQERSRSDDLLWTGSAYQEYSLWEERYEGGLTETERAFARAMREREHRQKRRRRLAVTSSFTFLLIVLAVIGNLWWTARDRALQNEAVRLLEAGADLLEFNSSRALACAIASLERVDTPEARSLAMKILWAGPTEFVPPRVQEAKPTMGADFSPDDNWLATGSQDAAILLWPSDGGPPERLNGPDGFIGCAPMFSPTGRWLIATFYSVNEHRSVVVLWSFETRELAHQWEVTAFSGPLRFAPDGERILALVEDATTESGYCVEWWATSDGGRVQLGSPPGNFGPHGETFVASKDARWLASWEGRNVYVSSIDSNSLGPRRWIGEHDQEVGSVNIDADGDLVGVNAGIMLNGSTMFSRHRPGEPVLTRSERLAFIDDAFDYSHDLLFTADRDSRPPSGLADMRGPASASARNLRLDEPFTATPKGPWLAAANSSLGGGLRMYPLRSVFPHTLSLGSAAWGSHPISDDGRYAAVIREDTLWLCDLHETDSEARPVFQGPDQSAIRPWVFDPAGERIVASPYKSGAWVIPVQNGEPMKLEGSHDHTMSVAFSPEGDLIATGAGAYYSGPKSVLIWNREGEQVDELEPAGDIDSENASFYDLEFLSETKLLGASLEGLMLWDLETRECRILAEGQFESLAVGRGCFVAQSSETVLYFDRETLVSRELTFPFVRFTTSLAISSDESFVVAGFGGGAIRIMFLDGDVLHELPSQVGGIYGLWIDPRGYWIAAVDHQGSLQYWPVPRGEPLRDRPRDELLAILRAQTNRRATIDASAPSVLREYEEEFAGWESAPTWQEWASREYYVDPPWTSLREVLEKHRSSGDASGR